METTKQLAEDLARLPARAVSAVRILQTLDDPNTSAARLAGLVELDPVLSARVLRLANAPYYGLARRVSSASRAVILLGLSTVRAIAASAAAGLLEEDDGLAPAGLWTHSVATGSASSVIAAHVPGVSVGDAFSAGLIHDLGASVLLRRRAPRYIEALTSSDPISAADLEHLEMEEFGITHAAAGAKVFEAWRFPPQLVRAVASHHTDPAYVADALARVVIAGEAFALHVLPGVTSEEPRGLDEVTDALGLRATTIPGITREVRREIQASDRFLRAGR